MTPDVNLLVAASRSDHPHHAASRAWLTQALGMAAVGTSLSLMPLVVASFLRLVTSPKIFKAPADIDDAISFVDALLAQPGVSMASMGPEWPLLRQLCLDKKLTSNHLPDAWLAAATLHLGEHLVTFDADFRRLLPRSQVTVLAAMTH
jgi:toxin-antitoxin system PIN domain toxin